MKIAEIYRMLENASLIEFLGDMEVKCLTMVEPYTLVIFETKNNKIYIAIRKETIKSDAYKYDTFWLYYRKKDDKFIHLPKHSTTIIGSCACLVYKFNMRCLKGYYDFKTCWNKFTALSTNSRSLCL